MQLSFEQTYKFALNSSSSKSQHLFPKAQRFAQPKRKQQKIRFYTLPSAISYQQKKAPSFPKLVKKMEFPEERSKKIVPSPSTYSIKSDLQRSLSERRGATMPKQELTRKFHVSTPGPGNYNPKKEPYLTARYSIGHSKKKLEFPIELQKGKQSPGPAYLVNVEKLQKVVSKYVNKKCLKVYSEPSFKHLRSQSVLNPESKLLLQSRKKKPQQSMKLFERGSKVKPAVPNFSNLFESSISKNEHSVMGRFNKAERKTIFETKPVTPGPGYNWFSEFSKLQKKAYNEKIRGQKSKKQHKPSKVK